MIAADFGIPSFTGETTMTEEQARQVAKTIPLRDFDRLDWMAFCGCQSENPKMGWLPEYDNPFVDDYGYFVIVDGDLINIVHCEDIGGGVICDRGLDQWGLASGAVAA
jgi:hypothetical protein